MSVSGSETGDEGWTHGLGYHDTDRITLPAVLAGVISGFLCPDRAIQGLVVGWGSTLETLVT